MYPRASLRSKKISRHAELWEGPMYVVIVMGVFWGVVDLILLVSRLIV